MPSVQKSSWLLKVDASLLTTFYVFVDGDDGLASSDSEIGERMSRAMQGQRSSSMKQSKYILENVLWNII